MTSLAKHLPIISKQNHLAGIAKSRENHEENKNKLEDIFQQGVLEGLEKAKLNYLQEQVKNIKSDDERNIEVVKKIENESQEIKQQLTNQINQISNNLGEMIGRIFNDYIIQNCEKIAIKNLEQQAIKGIGKDISSCLILSGKSDLIDQIEEKLKSSGIAIRREEKPPSHEIEVRSENFLITSQIKSWIAGLSEHG